MTGPLRSLAPLAAALCCLFLTICAARAGAEPPPSERLLPEAAAAFQAGDMARAEALYRQVLAREPHAPEALNQLGLIYLRTGRTGKAFAELEILRLAHPDDPRVHFNLSRIFNQARLPDRERQALINAIRLKPDFPEAHQNLANLLARAGEYYAAANEYAWLVERAERLGQPPDPDVLSSLRALQEKLSRHAPPGGLR